MNTLFEENDNKLKLIDKIISDFKMFKTPYDAFSFMASQAGKDLDKGHGAFLDILGKGAKAVMHDQSVFFLRIAPALLVDSVKNGLVKVSDIKNSIKNFSEKNQKDTTGIDYDNLDIDSSTLKFSSLFGNKNDKKPMMDFVEYFNDEIAPDIKDRADKKVDKVVDAAKEKGVDISEEDAEKNAAKISKVIKDNPDLEGEKLSKIIGIEISEKPEEKKDTEKEEKKEEVSKEEKTDNKDKEEKSADAEEKPVKKTRKSGTKKKVDKLNTTDDGGGDIKAKKISKTKKDGSSSKKEEKAKKDKKDKLDKKEKKEEKAKKNKKDEKSKKDKKEKSVNKDEKKKKKDDKSISKIDSKLRSSLVTELADSKNKDRGLLVQKMTVGELKKHMTSEEQQKLSNIKAKAKDNIIVVMLKAPRKLHWLKGEDKTDEAEGWRFTIFKPNNTKRKDIKDFVKMAVSTIKSEVKDVDKIFKYRRTFTGRHTIGKTKNSGVKYDSMILIATLKNKKLNESLLNEDATNELIVSGETLTKISKWWKENWWKATGHEDLRKQIEDMSSTSPFDGKLNFGNFDYKKYDDESQYEKFKELLDEYNKLEAENEDISFYQNVSKHAVKDIINGEDASAVVHQNLNPKMKEAFEYAKTHSEVAGDLRKKSQEFIEELKGLEDAPKSEVKEFVQDNIQTKVVGGMTSQEITDSFKELGVNRKDVLKLFANSKSNMALNAADSKLTLFMDGFKANFDKDPKLAITSLLKSGRSPEAKDALAEIACKINPDAKKYFEDAGIKINGSIDGLADAAADVKEQAQEQAQKQRSGWRNSSLGWTVVAWKLAGAGLNNGSKAVDAIGEIAVKKKEDKDIIAEVRCLVKNAGGPKNKQSDTKFSLRYSIADFKWHATNLDNRKMKFDEDKLIAALMKNDDVKKFKERCLSRWESVFEKANGTDVSPVSFLCNNKSIQKTAKINKDMILWLQLMSDNFNKIQKDFK